MRRALWCALWCAAVVPAAAAESTTLLRMAAIAPDGTAWARELKAWARDIESGSEGRVRVKWYLGGIAGDETQALARVGKGQLDGMAGAIFCQQLAPSLRVVRLPGLFESRAEAQAVMARLKPRVDRELADAGFVNLGLGTFGDDALFTRHPVRTLDELKRTPLFVWSLDPAWAEVLSGIGGQPRRLALDEAARAYDDGRIDGFLAAPTAALAYQWSAQSRFVADLHAALLPGCMVLSLRAFDALTPADRERVRSASSTFFVRFNQVNDALEAQLMGGLFEKQGLRRLPASPELRAAFFAAARAARAQLREELVPRRVLTDVELWLHELRAARGRP